MHFGVFNMFITNGVMLTTRTLLHMKMIPSEPLLIFDKIISTLCFILMILDTIDLIETTISFARKHTKQEIEDIHKSMDKAKEFLKKELKEKIKENQGLPNVEKQKDKGITKNKIGEDKLEMKKKEKEFGLRKNHLERHGDKIDLNTILESELDNSNAGLNISYTPFNTRMPSKYK